VLEDGIQTPRLVLGPDEQGRGIDAAGTRQVELHDARAALGDEDVEPDRLVVDGYRQPVLRVGGQPVAEPG